MEKEKLFDELVDKVQIELKRKDIKQIKSESQLYYNTTITGFNVFLQQRHKMTF